MAGAFIVACGADNVLSGSVSELLPNGLSVSRVEILRNAEALQVSYYNNRDQDIDLVARVTVSAVGVELRDGQKIDLAGEYEPGHQRTTVISLLSGEPTRFFAPVQRGDLKITSGGEDKASIAGNFSMLFQEEEEGFGAGRTLEGSFSGPAADAGYDPVLPDAGEP